nr:MAG: hypothetical protein [Porcellio scaber clopovirus]
MDRFLEKEKDDNNRKKIETNKKKVSFSEDPSLFPRRFNKINLGRRKNLRKIEEGAAYEFTASKFLPEKRLSTIPFQDKCPSVIISIFKSKNEILKKKNREEKKLNSGSLLNLNKDPLEIGKSAAASRDYSPNGTFQNMSPSSDFSIIIMMIIIITIIIIISLFF